MHNMWWLPLGKHVWSAKDKLGFEKRQSEVGRTPSRGSCMDEFSLKRWDNNPDNRQLLALFCNLAASYYASELFPNVFIGCSIIFIQTLHIQRRIWDNEIKGYIGTLLLAEFSGFRQLILLVTLRRTVKVTSLRDLIFLSKIKIKVFQRCHFQSRTCYQLL